MLAFLPVQQRLDVRLRGFATRLLAWVKEAEVTGGVHAASSASRHGHDSRKCCDQACEHSWREAALTADLQRDGATGYLICYCRRRTCSSSRSSSCCER